MPVAVVPPGERRRRGVRSVRRDSLGLEELLPSLPHSGSHDLGVFLSSPVGPHFFLFAAYHPHMPWVIPTALVDTLAIAYPTRRYRSALVRIVVHSAQSIIILLAVTALVLR
jgi:hypothetical protein